MNAPSQTIGDPGARAQRLIHVSDPADVGEARRQGIELAQLLAFDAATTGQLALGITEAGTNIVKHARDGMVLLRPLADAGEWAVEALVLDRGEGIRDLALSMRDGYSTAGTPGGGLGALARMTQALEIFSLPGKGTALRFEVRRRAVSAPASAALLVGGVCVPKPDEQACGDAWTLVREEGRHILAVIDGLGHGLGAAAAAHIAIDVTQRRAAGSSAVELVQLLHAALRASRGAAGAVAVLEPGRGSGTFCGIGNISCTIRSPHETRKLVSHDGILGHRSRRIHEYSFAFPADATLIAHSDGLNTHWQLDAYPGLARHHPALIAGVLYRDHARGSDDATCVVLRQHHMQSP